MELYKANKQWAKRPDDEKFPSLQALYDATRAYAQDARTATVPFSTLRTEGRGEDVMLVGKTNAPARMTHWAFGQLCARVGAPADYLRGLHSTLAAQNLNYGLAHRQENGGTHDAQLLFHTNGGLLVRALTGEVYERVWNYEIAERLLGWESRGWTPARPTFNVIEGKDWPALYASDHDMFAFLTTDRIVEEAGHPKGGLYRGFIVENGEVGDVSLALTRFLYDEMCGNHIIWGAKNVIELRIRHVGEVHEKLRTWEAELRKYANESTSDEAAKIARAKTVRIAATKEEVLDRLFGMRAIGLSRKVLTAGYEAAETAYATEAEPDVPQTVWGMVGGLTRHSQTVPYADRRNEIDRAAGKILTINF